MLSPNFISCYTLCLFLLQYNREKRYLYELLKLFVVTSFRIFLENFLYPNYAKSFDIKVVFLIILYLVEYIKHHFRLQLLNDTDDV